MRLTICVSGSGPLLADIYRDIFSDFVDLVANFVSDGAGVLSRFVNLTAPENRKLLAFIYLEKKTGKSGKKYRLREKKTENINLGPRTLP